MSTRNYWLILFSEATWQEFLDSGAHISGFREGRWKTLQQVKPGDYFLCYLTRFSRWIGILEVSSAPFKDNTPIWKDETFPSRVEVKVIISLTPETAVPITLLRDQLSIFENLSSPFAWTGHVRSSPTRWKPSDGEIILKALLDAQANPITRPITKQKQERLATVLPTKVGVVTVPNGEESADESLQTEKEPTLHTETQWLL